MNSSSLDAAIAEDNAPRLSLLQADYEVLGAQLVRRGVDIERLVSLAQAFRVAVPSWGFRTGGTRFARFPGPGEPRTIYEKIEDAEVLFRLVRTTPGISIHLPWDQHDNPGELLASTRARGLHFDSTNSNTFEDQPDQALSYKFGSLAHTDAAVRRQAIEHNVCCLELGRTLGATAHTVWVGDGANFPGQQHLRQALDRYLDSLRHIYTALDNGGRLFIEHKLFEPAFYTTVNSDWGTSYYCARELGSRAFSLVDLGHHAPNVNIEQIVARLIQFGKLGGLHFNDSWYGDDDLDTGSVKPFQLFLIFNELVAAEQEGVPEFEPRYMLDQSHNVTDPLESLMLSAVELVRAYVQAHLVDRALLAECQAANDPLQALSTLKRAFTTDVSPILGTARYRAGGAIEPLLAYRALGYRARQAIARPAEQRRTAEFA